MIKSELKTTKTYQSFPKLMEDKVSGNVILFLNKREGTLVYKAIANFPFPLGTHRLWDIQKYENLKGSITLSNNKE